MRYALVALTLLASPAMAQETFQHRCPDAGTHITLNDGTALSFTRSEGLTCFYRTPGNSEERGWYASVFSAGFSYAKDYRTEIAKLWPARVGNRVTFQPMDGGMQGWQVDLVIREKTKVTVPAGTFDVLVIDYITEGIRSNFHKSTRRFWYAPEVGFHIKYEPILERGSWGFTPEPKPFVATRVVKP